MRLLLLLVWLMVATAAEAAYMYTFNSGFANGGNIPDANTTGWSDTRTLSGIGDTVITDVNVTINVSGGYNGDLYVYLSHGSGFSVLLNRVGRTSGNSFGYSDAGFNVTFNDQASQSIDFHLYQTVNGFSLNGSEWRPDARNVSPLTVTDGASRTALLSAFNNLNPNGDWTLFVADLSGGSVSQIQSWSLQIEAVPEPTTVALGIFAAGFVGTAATRSYLKRRHSSVFR